MKRMGLFILLVVSVSSAWAQTWREAKPVFKMATGTTASLTEKVGQQATRHIRSAESVGQLLPLKIVNVPAEFTSVKFPTQIVSASRIPGQMAQARPMELKGFAASEIKRESPELMSVETYGAPFPFTTEVYGEVFG